MIQDPTPVMIIQFRKDGSRGMIYRDDFPIEQLGLPHVKRASDVEFNDDTQEWEVTLKGDDKPSYSCRSRAACIAWEIDTINNSLSDVLDQHFPIS